MVKVTALVSRFSCTLILWMGIITPAPAVQVGGFNESHGCVISGKVAHRGSSIRGATIHVRPVQTWDELGVSAEARRLGSASVETSLLPSIKSDEEGRFCIDAVEPGHYTVSAKKSGYMETAYGAATPFESGAILAINKGETYPKIEINLIAQAVLTGRVVDPDGDPVDQGSVIVISNVALRGAYRTLAIRNVPLNDLGEFRASQLPPGRYYLRFQPHPRSTRQLSGSSQGVLRQMPRLIATFYPSAVMITQTAPVILQAGDTVSNIVITAQRQKTYSIRGRLAGLDGFAVGAVMSILPADEEQTIIIAGGGNLNEDNTFAFDDISSGNYTITYIDHAPTYLQLPISVADSDVDDLIIRPPSGLQVKGRIILDAMHGDAAEVKVALRPATDRVVSPVFIATVQNSGVLTFDKPIPPGVYRVHVETPKGNYVKSLHYGGTIVTRDLIELSEVGGHLTIVVGAGTGELEVRVRHHEEQQSAGTPHYVVLQTEADEGVQVMRMTAALDDATAVLKDIPPGRHRVYAFRSVDAAAVVVPETLRHLKEFGTTVEVSANTLATATVRVVPPQRAAEAFAGAANSR